VKLAWVKTTLAKDLVTSTASKLKQLVEDNRRMMILIAYLDFDNAMSKDAHTSYDHNDSPISSLQGA
jgi:hypothetical protein